VLGSWLARWGMVEKCTVKGACVGVMVRFRVCVVCLPER
jgi:hypothetical protein